MQKKIGTIIIGGTFNPVHFGHIYLIHEVIDKCLPDRTIVVPSYISSHKVGKPVLSGQHRLEMLRLALKNEEIIIEDCEIKRKGISYSIDTVRYLKKKYRIKERPGFVIGDDLIKGFETWKEAYKLSGEVLLIIAIRNKTNTADMKYEHIILENSVKKVSSSEIRDLIKDGKSCNRFLPAEVYDYIKKNKLYGAS